MSGETEKSVSGWTTDTLNAHIIELHRERDLRAEQRFQAHEIALETAFIAERAHVAAAIASLYRVIADRDQFLERLAAERDRQVQTAFLAAESAVRKAESATEKRFDGVNEFRKQLADQAATFLPRKEFDVQLGAAIEAIDALRRTVEASSFVTRELFDRYVKEQGEVHTRIFDQLTVTYNDISNMKGRQAAYVVALGVFFTVMTIATSIFIRVL